MQYQWECHWYFLQLLIILFLTPNRMPTEIFLPAHLVEECTFPPPQKNSVPQYFIRYLLIFHGSNQLQLDWKSLVVQFERMKSHYRQLQSFTL